MFVKRKIRNIPIVNKIPTDLLIAPFNVIYIFYIFKRIKNPVASRLSDNSILMDGDIC